MNKIKVYIINLKNDFIKKNKCINELNKYNINYEFIQAIDGSKLKPEYVNPNISWFEPTWHYHMTMGEIGCAYSHFSIWNKIIKEGKKLSDQHLQTISFFNLGTVLYSLL